jgi:hypothetical protein
MLRAPLLLSLYGSECGKQGDYRPAPGIGVPLRFTPGRKAPPMFEDADLIHRYTRADAIRDGVLIDVTQTAREAGFRWPVARSIPPMLGSGSVYCSCVSHVAYLSPSPARPRSQTHWPGSASSRASASWARRVCSANGSPRARLFRSWRAAGVPVNSSRWTARSTRSKGLGKWE